MKEINDTYGHPFGDKVLAHFSEVARGVLRKSDIFARYGGEEFMAVLPETNAKGAEYVVSRIRERFLANPIRHGDGMIRVTFSAGVTEYQPGMQFDDMVAIADSALYAAKAAGRDCARIAYASDEQSIITAGKRAVAVA